MPTESGDVKPFGNSGTLIDQVPAELDYDPTKPATAETELAAPYATVQAGAISVSTVKYLLVAMSLILFFAGSVARMQTQDKEPIASVGHGAFFDHDGKQIEVTLEFVAKAQDWYRKKLLSSLGADKKAAFANVEKRLKAAVKAEGQTRLLVRQHLLDWLVANSEATRRDVRTVGKLNALKFALRWKLPERPGMKDFIYGEEFKIAPEIEEQLRAPEFTPGGIQLLSVTTNSGQAYIDECRAAGVPIPPPIGRLDPAGLAGWKSQGFIPGSNQFIVGSPAEVRTFQSSSPAGMCIALPRYTDNTRTTVALDGVICLGQASSKVCFWDNQMRGATFTFPSGTMVPIGVPDTSINPAGQYQAGGFELEAGAGGVCTDCHAGQNPYIIHPNVDLGGGAGPLMGDLNRPPLSLPTFSASRYDPLVQASWAQNQLSHSPDLVPAVCSGCHRAGGTGGAFPHLSSEIRAGYCNTVLANAIARTMPPSNPGGEAGNPAVIAFRAWCDSAASSGPSNRGDPHIETADDIHYDFQSAGEFVSLRSGTDTEIQTRQTAISTSFFPGPDAYTGLATCVSVNTAVAARVGSRRVTYEPNLSGVPDPNGLQLRVDGVLTTLGASGLDLGGGGRIGRTSAAGGIEVDFPDGTVMFVTPGWWADQGKWYLDVDVPWTPAVRGIMGVLAPGSWLPALPDGTSLGPKPASPGQRYDDLYRKFADAWRVTSSNSLFDYAPGTSTDTFTLRSWPQRDGPCVVPRTPVAHPVEPEVAEKACSQVMGKNRHDDCVFDVMVTGELGFAKTYLATQQVTGPETDTDGGNTTNPSNGKVALFLDFGAGIPHSTFSNFFDPGFSFNGGLEYIVGPQFSAAGTFGYHRFPSAFGGDTNLFQFTANAKTYLTPPPDKVRPFLNGGIGAYKFGSGPTHFGGNVGAGLLYEATPRFGLQGSYNFHMVNTPGFTTRFSTLQGGVRFVF